MANIVIFIGGFICGVYVISVIHVLARDIRVKHVKEMFKDMKEEK